MTVRETVDFQQESWKNIFDNFLVYGPIVQEVKERAIQRRR